MEARYGRQQVKHEARLARVRCHQRNLWMIFERFGSIFWDTGACHRIWLSDLGWPDTWAIQPPQNFGVTMTWCRAIWREMNLNASGFPLRQAGASRGAPILPDTFPGTDHDLEDVAMSDTDGEDRNYDEDLLD